MGKEFVIDNLDDMCNLMCNNQVPKEAKNMDRIINDVRVYAATIAEDLANIAIHNQDKLTVTEIQFIQDAARLILHNMKEIVRE